jgi:hypothetical protein
MPLHTQAEVFDHFLRGDTLEGCYAAVAAVADRFLDLIDTRGVDMEVRTLAARVTRLNSARRKTTGASPVLPRLCMPLDHESDERGLRPQGGVAHPAECACGDQVSELELAYCPIKEYGSIRQLC